MPFLPEDFSIPESNSHYLEFVEGENRFRALSDAVCGWQFWKNEAGEIISAPKKGCKPIYVRQLKDIPTEISEDHNLKLKPFWAFEVWNYATEQVQICKITQTSLMRSITSFVRHADWGNPQAYDIITIRKGEGLQTQYTVLVGQKKPIDEGIKAMAREMNIDLEAYFRGEDPFGSVEEQAQEKPQPRVAAPQVSNGVYTAVSR